MYITLYTNRTIFNYMYIYIYIIINIYVYTHVYVYDHIWVVKGVTPTTFRNFTSNGEFQMGGLFPLKLGIGGFFFSRAY